MQNPNILIEISPKEMLPEPGPSRDRAVKSLQATLTALVSLNETLGPEGQTASPTDKPD